MKKIFALLLLTVVSACAQVETLDLGSRGTLTLYLLGDWKTEVSTLGKGNEITLSIRPSKESVNASCTFTVSFPDVDRFDTKSKLKMRVEIDGQGFAAQSVEGRAIAREFTLTSGYGFYCNFTDAELRGQPMKPGDYKVATAGKIRLNAQVLVDVFIGAEGFREEAYQQLLGAIEGMEFKPGR
jgi:hypothetical protein